MANGGRINQPRGLFFLSLFHTQRCGCSNIFSCSALCTIGTPKASNKNEMMISRIKKINTLRPKLILGAVGGGGGVEGFLAMS